MLPVEPSITLPEVIQRVLSCEAISFIFVVCLAFTFAESYCQRLKWLWCLIISIVILFVMSAFIAQFFSMLIGRPQRPTINSFNELLASGLRIFGMQAEFDGMAGDFRAKYASAFQLTNNPKELYIRRNFFNTSWAYTITKIKWHIMETHQRYFTHPVFRYSENLCFNGFTPYSLIISENCVFRDTIRLYIMEIYQSGLLDYWLTHSFYDMVKAGHMQIKDYSTIYHLRALRLEDYRFARWFCSVGLVMAFAVFVLELMQHWVNIFLDSL
ncbi:uncharacterized protein Dwil_GK18974 [Drosophila willistoni]|uniref:Ionotropic glutamate receptor C-terminal domain-containing protein n=2 Tax=Drosophila willistoni TaxID=7260 RepID=B4NGR4_DROWI|nr:uncharacterized protein Dwil_GK18974 [Drosophila willistoni]